MTQDAATPGGTSGYTSQMMRYTLSNMNQGSSLYW